MNINAYFTPIVQGALMVAGIALLLWFVLARLEKVHAFNTRDASLTSEELDDHARKTALEHSVSRKKNLLNWPVPRLNGNYDYILSTYRQLNEDLQKRRTVQLSAEWLLDNFYIIEEQVKVLRRELTKKSYLRLPVLRAGPFKGYARIFAIAAELVAHTDGHIDETTLSDYLKAYQSRNVLFDREIWAIPVVIRLALIENIRALCEDIQRTQRQWQKADELYDAWLKNEDRDAEKASKTMDDRMRGMDDINPSLIEHLSFRLRRSGRNSVFALRSIDHALIRFETSIEQITQREHSARSLNTVSMGNTITSLRDMGTLDYSDLFESASFVDQVLRQDPDGTYPKMDLNTRNHYRSRIEEIASIYGVSEIHIAREALELAKRAYESRAGEDASILTRNTGHVGYYLIGDGLENLKRRQGKAASPYWRALGSDNHLPKALYFGSILLMTLILTATAIWVALFMAAGNGLFLAILAGIAVLIPASEISVNLVNWITCRALRPAFFPRLALKAGIPEEFRAMVVVPTLLPDPGRVRELLKNLEAYFLVNREENLYFTLVGAFRDSDSPIEGDDQTILDAAMQGIAALNRKYAAIDADKFFFCHRERQYNAKNCKWIGWERKRGALMEFDELLLGSEATSFTTLSNKTISSLNIQYVITLDSDTILPMGMAKKMIGAMAHPLNRPVIDPRKGIVTAGYGIMQPRIGVDIESSNRSLFSRIFTDQEGIDPYANAISDVYQDLFGEGIFTGKGIYDLKAFHTVLKDAISDNSVLSHDLLEGSYARTALVSDLKLIDAFPSGYGAFSDRMQRWTRGDWQLLPYLFPRIFDRSCKIITNPLSQLSKWKMLDNLRKSLVAPSLLILAMLSFSVLPGDSAFWLGFFFLSSQFSLVMALAKFLFAPWFPSGKTKRHTPQITGVKAAFLQGLLQFIFIPQQAAQALGAMFVTLARVFVTNRNLLQWVTSAEVEKTRKNSLGSYIMKMSASWFAALAVLILAAALKPEAAIIGLIFSILWASAPFVAYAVSIERTEKALNVSEADRARLGRIARKTWRYFEEFVNAKSNYLAPDNYQEDPPRGIAPRTSPTNIGLGLMAALSARDFGYIGTVELVDLIDKTIMTMEGLAKWNGHLYNWYDTRTLKPLRPGYVSAVDSGNLVGYLITLEQGLTGYLRSPLVDERFLDGILDTLGCAGQGDSEDYLKIAALRARCGKEPLDEMEWSRTIGALSDGEAFDGVPTGAWKVKLDHMAAFFKREMPLLTPHVALIMKHAALTQGESASEQPGDLGMLLGLLNKSRALCETPAVYEDAASLARRMIERSSEANVVDDRVAFLRELEEALQTALQNTRRFIDRYEALILRIHALSTAMVFTPLYVKKKQLFSLGYNTEENEFTDSCYDLLASEARQTSFISIARGEVPESHWFRLGRSLTAMDGYKGLVSWSGTMFEYLMPLLIMKNYQNTLLDETYSFVIRNQKKYGKQRSMPWGVSESGFNAQDIHHDYQYKAIGVPWLGLKRGLIEDAVASPYSTFLALLVDPEGAIQNIVRLEDEGMDGPYGFYEAVDYTPERLQFGQKHAVVKSHMAHHQGMSLLALNNFLHHNVLQERFDADPEMHASRLLLWEKVPTTLLFTKDSKEKVLPFKQDVYDERTPVRSFNLPDPVLPKAHILSNGNYSVMLTDRGTGYSGNKMVNVTRWREDLTLDPFGMFFYLRNVETDAVWSAAYAPLNTMPQQYEVVFTSDKATFKRLDGQIETKTEVTVASGDNVEFRRISLKNLGQARCVLEITSYSEVVLAPQAADVAHPAFGNLFVETRYQADKKYVLANRRPRSDSEREIWTGTAAVSDGEPFGEVQFETDRMRFLGRGNTAKKPQSMDRGRPLTNTVGSVLDPVMSLRVTVQIDPGKTATVSFVMAIGQNCEALLLLLDRYAASAAVSQAFQLALARSRVETKYLGLAASQIECFQDMLSDLLFLSPRRRTNPALIPKGGRGQASLWQFGISGDLPIVLVILKKLDQVELLFEVMKAHEYWWMLGLKVDLVIISDEEFGYDNPLHTLILDAVSLPQAQLAANRARNIFVIKSDNLQPEDVQFLRAVARIVLSGDEGSLEEQMAIPAAMPPSVRPPILKFYARKPEAFASPEGYPQDLQYYNGLGGFTPDGNEYVIRLDKGQNTPAPWVNVLANRTFGCIASASGSGFTWHDNSRENKLTPWSNDQVSDGSGEAFYISDLDSGECFTITALPIREDEPYTITHGFGYTLYEHTSHGIRQRLTQHVPVDGAVKVNLISLKNTSGRKRTMTVTFYMRPVLGVSDQETAMHIRTSVSTAGALLIENPYRTHAAGEICFIDASLEKRRVTGDRREFFGAGDMSAPDCLLLEGLSGATGVGFDPCGAMQVKVRLDKDESRDLVFLLGAAASLQEVDDLSRRYLKVGQAKESLRAVQAFWKEKIRVVRVKTPTDSMNLMLNGWLTYQVIACRLWARSGFYQSGGAFGFRDQLQDCLSIAHLWPEIARAQILRHAQHQFLEGDVQHWWHEPEGGGIRSRISDDRLWLPYAAMEYIRITGDSAILAQTLSFLEDAPLSELEDERYSQPNVSSFQSTLYDHCVRAVEVSLKFGSHGLPLMGTGDWNDGMNAVGSKGLGESVWLGWFLANVLEMFAPVCQQMGDIEKAAKYLDTRKEILAAIEENAWDGNWYRRAYFDDGSALGSAANQECRIDSIAQTWAVLSGGGDPERAKTAMNSLAESLIQREDGLIKLLTPPFNGEESDPGYIRAYVPGVRENGGQYTHAAAWVIIAFAKLGDGDKAWELFRLINPIKHTESDRECSRYKLEPYVMAADVYAASPHAGRGGWSWYTGSAGWMVRAGLEHILGFQKNADTVVIDPCIPKKWREYSIQYRYMDTTYDITVSNPDGVCRGVRGITVDGLAAEGNRFALVNDGAIHNVQVTMGLSDSKGNS